MCPREGAPRFLLVSVFSAPGKGAHNTGPGLHMLWKDILKYPKFKFGERKCQVVKLIIILLFSSYVFN